MSKAKTSPNKVEANRRNAKKSTGPRSAAGKAKSSRNAVKHGLLAGRIVLADNPEEDPQQFGELLDGLREDYQPQSMIETMLVERLAASFWRLRRAYRFEVEAITQANQPNPLADALDELARLAPVRKGEHILPASHTLERLVRYETMIDRELLRTMRQLELRQRFRKIDEATQRQQELHGQEYLPMPPERSASQPRRTSLSRTLQGADHPPSGATPVRSLKATAQEGAAALRNTTRPCAGAREHGSAKAPAPNEATVVVSATPRMGSGGRWEQERGDREEGRGKRGRLHSRVGRLDIGGSTRCETLEEPYGTRSPRDSQVAPESKGLLRQDENGLSGKWGTLIARKDAGGYD